jgi:D-alanyl-lipoteichoic acid acyltransferase DltB (MBOAT superfamily)
MTSTSVWFFAIAGLALAFYLALPTPMHRRLILLATNVGFVITCFGSPHQALPLVAFLLAGYGCAKWIGPQSHPWQVALAMGGLLSFFVYLKQYPIVSFVHPLWFAYSAIGLSYVLFRVLHIVLDRRQGALAAAPSLIDYINYTCLFPCFVSGPVQRYEDFARGGQARDGIRLTEAALVVAASRIIAGLFKVFVMSSTFDGLFTTTSTVYLAPAEIAGGLAAAVSYAAAASLYALYLYYNFSGYTDIAIGVGRLFGFAIPENFNRPFAARNFIEFWTRWHMSLSDWFKIYLFNPFLKALLVRFPKSSLAPFNAVVAFFLTFLVIGLWHGTTIIFLYYGLVLGFGISVNKLYQVLLIKHLGKKGFQALAANTRYAAMCRGMNFAYFAIALTCFWVDTTRLASLCNALGTSGVVVAFGIITIGATVIGIVADRVGAIKTRMTARFASWRKHAAVNNAWLATEILALTAVATLFNASPEFVYQGF